jgi:type I restriction enzyme S subunit
MTIDASSIETAQSLHEGWVESPLGDIATLLSGSTPSSNVSAYWGGHVIWITPRDLSSLGGALIRSSERSLTEAGRSAASLPLVPKGALVLSSRAPIGHLGIADVPLTINQGCKALVFGHGHDPVFHFYNLGFRMDRIRARGEGTTFQEVSRKELAKVRMPYPTDVAEQRSIGAILLKIDAALDSSRALLKKYQLLHDGLTAAMLTRGIDAAGALRSEDTHAFRRTPLGRLPIEWDAVPLGDVLRRIDYGLSVGMEVQGAVPILRMNNLVDAEVDISSLKFVDAEVAASRLLRQGDVLFNRTNSIEHVGRTAIWRSQLPVCTFASYLLRLVPDGSKLTNAFLNAAMNRGHVQDRLKQIATRGVQQANINPTNLRSFRIPLPSSVDEQQRITDVLDRSGGALATIRQELEKLTRLKAGLMQALLTRDIRTAPSAPYL